VQRRRPDLWTKFWLTGWPALWRLRRIAWEVDMVSPKVQWLQHLKKYRILALLYSNFDWAWSDVPHGGMEVLVRPGHGSGSIRNYAGVPKLRVRD